MTLEREPWTVPDEYRFGEDGVVPLRAGETVFWRVSGPTAHALMPGPGDPDAGNLAARMLSYPSEASQTVAARASGGGKSGLRRAGCRVMPGRDKSPLARMTKARNRATETSRRGSNRGG